MTGHYSRMTGFGSGVVERMRSRLEASVGFRWNDIEPKRLAMSFKAEALVMHDHDDPELPASEGEGLARVLPVAKVVLTEGLGHRRILRDSRVVGRAVDFIASFREERAQHEEAPAA